MDVTGLVEDGKGIDSFEQLLAKDRAKIEEDEGRNQKSNGSDESKKPLEALKELGEMLSWEEHLEIQSHNRSISKRDSFSVASSTNLNSRKEINTRNGGRRVLSDEDDSEAVETAAWGLPRNGLNGKLPGVYQNYMLVRPHPSLRIIFVSPALRIPGLLQSNFLSRVGGPSSIRDGIEDAFAQGVPVTAKVSWLPIGKPVMDDNDDLSTDEQEYGNVHVHGSGAGNRGASNGYGTGRHALSQISQLQQARTRWLSCTPLCGSDDRVGVWMVVMVEDTNAARFIGVRAPTIANGNAFNNANGIERIDSGRRLATTSPQRPSTSSRLEQETAGPKNTQNPRSLDSSRASISTSSTTSSKPAHNPHSRGITQVPPRGSSNTLSARPWPPALSPNLSPTLGPDAVESWIPSSNGTSTRNTRVATSNSSASANGVVGATAHIDYAGQAALQTQKALADFTAKMAAPRREGMVVSDRGVDLRNGRVMEREKVEGRVRGPVVGVAS